MNGKKSTESGHRAASSRSTYTSTGFIRGWLALLPCLLMLSGCVDRAEREGLDGIPGTLLYALTDEERKCLVDKASVGDCDAAYRVFQYYRSLHNEAASREWLKRAAECGLPIAQLRYGIEIYFDSPEQNGPEARKWVERARAGGFVLVPPLPF